MSNQLPSISSDIIFLNVIDGEPVTISHGSGRQVTGWLVIWQNAVISFTIADALADTRNDLTLRPHGTGSVRLVLL